MTLQQLIDLKISFQQLDLDDRDGTAPTTAQQVASVNWAIRAISRLIFQYDPSIAFTPIADQDGYDLRGTAFSRKILRPYLVVINGNPLRTANGDDYGFWTLTEFEKIAPGWRTLTSGIPFRAAYQGTRLWLNPKPTADVVTAAGCYVAGQYMAADMTVSDLALSPDIPEELHECLAFFAAAKASLPFLTEQEAWQRAQAINAEWQDLVGQVRRENIGQIQNFGTLGTGGDYLCL